jgi:predicted dehydrogenase
MISRRTFLDGLAVTAAAAAVNSTAKSYAQILGSNDRLNFAVIGLNSRAYAHLAGLKANSSKVRISHVCDVDSVILDRFAGRAETAMGYAPAKDKDFRKLLTSKDVDAITIATPDHWHTPLAIDGLRAGKHVYVEKPCSHNPAEGALLVAAQKKYNKCVQMGTQRRSSQLYIDVAKKIQDGLIGRAYYAKGWYCNTRKSMGTGKVVPVPSTLDWDLWQGPVPRSEYKDNIHPYNWHWLRRYGTGEALNNGTHEIDVARWILGVTFPNRITAAGGRYAYKDDWQFYDTLNTSFVYDDDKLIEWEGKSCNGMKLYGRDRGNVIVGTTGSVVIDAGGYEVFDLKGNQTGDFKEGTAAASSDLTGADSMTNQHFANFIAAIHGTEKLNQPIDSGNISVTNLQLSNIAYFTNRELNIDPTNGHIKNDPEAMKYWGRTYEKGWAPYL